MTALPRHVRRALLLRGLLVQGAWNYQTLIGTGFAFVLLPVLRYLHRDDEAALAAAMARHTAVFNSHPYLVGVAAGAVARLETERVDPQLIARFKAALRGSLGALGDQLVWSAWRPAVALLGLALLLAGAPWWLSVAVFLLVYNGLHLWIRHWALEVGLRGGLNVGELLRQSPLHAWSRRAGDGGALLVGFCTVLAVAGPSEDLFELGLFAAAAAAGYGLGPWLRTAVWLALGLTWILGVMMGALREPLV